MSKNVKVMVVMGSQSDLKIMKAATDTLSEYGVSIATEILSAHRTPQLLEQSVSIWQASGVQVIIAGAGGAAHLPGMLASFAVIPVIGVPVKGSAMNGLDALLSVAQMPRGVPVATVAVDNATNAALLALEILALENSKEGARVRRALVNHKKAMAQQVMKDRKNLKHLGVSEFLKMRK